MKRLDDGEDHSEEYYGQYLVGNERKGDLQKTVKITSLSHSEVMTIVNNSVYSVSSFTCWKALNRLRTRCVPIPGISSKSLNCAVMMSAIVAYFRISRAALSFQSSPAKRERTLIPSILVSTLMACECRSVPTVLRMMLLPRFSYVFISVMREAASAAFQHSSSDKSDPAHFAHQFLNDLFVGLEIIQNENEDALHKWAITDLFPLLLPFHQTKHFPRTQWQEIG